MLQVQSYLFENSLEKLTSEFGIKIQRHDSLPLIILNYDQIKSPRSHPIVRECRGLILEDKTFKLIGKSFNRFFNWGEMIDESLNFNFKNFEIREKVDGSLCIIYNYNGKWMANTKGSFATDFMQGLNFTWQEAFLEALGVKDLQELNLNVNYTYICEFVSPYNKIVRKYNRPDMYLLTIFNGEKELSYEEFTSHWVCDDFNVFDYFCLPKYFRFSNIEEIQKYLEENSKIDATFEGVVIIDDQFNRWKIKSATYLSLHQMKGNGENIFLPKHLISFILSGETHELLVYFPEVEESLIELTNKFNSFKQEVKDVWEKIKDIENQKDFALIACKYKFSALLFNAKKTKRNPLDLLSDSKDYILKFIL